jgi:hypothetical protein
MVLIALAAQMLLSAVGSSLTADFARHPRLQRLLAGVLRPRGNGGLLAGNLAGNFLKKGPPRAILASKTITASIAYERIPCLTEQGIFLREQGIFSREQGILGPVRSKLHPPPRSPMRTDVSRSLRNSPQFAISSGYFCAAERAHRRDTIKIKLRHRRAT